MSLIKKLRYPEYEISKAQKISFAFLAFHLDVIESEKINLSSIVEEYSCEDEQDVPMDIRVHLIKSVWSVIDSCYYISKLMKSNPPLIPKVDKDDKLGKIFELSNKLRNLRIHSPENIGNLKSKEKLQPLNGVVTWTRAILYEETTYSIVTKLVAIDPALHQLGITFHSEDPHQLSPLGDLRIYAFNLRLDLSELFKELEVYKTQLEDLTDRAVKHAQEAGWSKNKSLKIRDGGFCFSLIQTGER